MQRGVQGEPTAAARAVGGAGVRSFFSSRGFRLIVAGLACSLWLGGVIYRLWDLQVRQAEVLVGRAQRQHQGEITMRATRGAILDRHGVELALSTPVESVGVFPKKVSDPEWLASILANVLGERPADVAEKLTGERFQWLRRQADPGVSERLKELNIKALHFEKESRRYYPKGTLAAHVLGFVGVDHEGLGGLELQYQDALSGRDGLRLVHYDALRQSYDTSIVEAPIPGAALQLTLDEGIQGLAEESLEKAIHETRARAGAIVVMDPQNGDVLALANWPTFDPNKRPSGDEQRDYAISALYEPGSTFKIVTVSAALEEGLTTPDELIDCQHGTIYIGRRRIRDHKAYDLLTVSDVLAHSSNVGAIKLGLRLGATNMHRYVRDVFHFGEPTGIELPGEAEGMVHPIKHWRDGSVASVSMGHEITVTPLQMAQAVSIVANGGMLVRPRLVDAVVDPSGRKRLLARPEPKRVLSAETAARLRAMMERTVSEGTGRLAITPGYRVGGKTGTAQMIDPDTHAYSHQEYMASFAGFAPVNNPSLTALIVLEAPHGAYYGGQVAAPVFRQVASQALRLRDVPEDLPTGGPRPVEDLPAALLADLADYARDPLPPAIPRGADGAILVAGASGRSSDGGEEKIDHPKSERGGKVNLRFTGLETPDLRGATLREALTEASRLGLRVETTGQGVVVRQRPTPGAPVEKGGLIRLELGRMVAEVRPTR